MEEPILRRARLRRVQALATGLLVAVTLLFVASSLLTSRWGAFALVRAFSEAALVGACADWFAVTSLFRRPFGLPIPHTAIVPRNKDRIGDALGRFIVENFLSPRVLDAKLRQLELAAWGGAWLQDARNAAALADRLVTWGPELVRALPSGALEALAGSVATNKNVNGSMFPPEALRWRFEGFVREAFDITDDGRVAHPRTVVAYPPFVFAKSTEETVRGFRYVPPRIGSTAVGCTGEIQSVRYRLP